MKKFISIILFILLLNNGKIAQANIDDFNDFSRLIQAIAVNATLATDGQTQCSPNFRFRSESSGFGYPNHSVATTTCIQTVDGKKWENLFSIAFDIPPEINPEQSWGRIRIPYFRVNKPVLQNEPQAFVDAITSSFIKFSNSEGFVAKPPYFFKSPPEYYFYQDFVSPTNSKLVSSIVLFYTDFAGTVDVYLFPPRIKSNN